MIYILDLISKALRNKERQERLSSDGVRFTADPSQPTPTAPPPSLSASGERVSVARSPRLDGNDERFSWDDWYSE